MTIKNSLCCALALLAFFFAMPANAQHLPPLPQGVADAEEARDWDLVIELCEKAIAKNPKRDDLWIRIANIEDTRGNSAEAKKALSKALKIKPDNVEYLRRHAKLAVWTQDSAGAEKSYRALLKQNPKDYKSLLGLGQTLSWQSKTKESLSVMEPYVASMPKEKEGLFLLSQLYMWDGQLEKSTELLERYRKVAGKTKDYKKIHMQLLAVDNQGEEVVAAANAVLKDNPRDCEALTTKATAFGSSRQPVRMLESLNNVSLYCKNKAAVSDIKRRLTTPLRDFARARYDYSTDSDTVKISTVTLDGRYQFKPDYYLTLGAETGSLEAAVGSGLETQAGRSSIQQSAAWIGLEKRLENDFWVNGMVGYHDAGGGIAQEPLLHGGVEFRPNDILTVSYDFHYDLYAVSPLSASKDVRLADNQLQGTWNIRHGTSVYAKGNYGFFSDDNRYWTAMIAPRQNIIQTEKFNADVGVSAQASGFSKNLNNGYYDPHTYRQFLATLGMSYWFTPDNMIGATGGIGKNKDNTMSNYERSNNYAVDGNFGLYKDWMLNLHAGHSDSIGINSNKYSLKSYTAALTSRF